MNKHKDKSKRDKTLPAANIGIQKKEKVIQKIEFIDNREQSVKQRKMNIFANSKTVQRATLGVIQRQQTDVCLKSANGTYKLNGDEATHNFTFRESSKGSDVLVTTQSHPKGRIDYTDKIIKLLKKDGTIPKSAEDIVLTASDTYGIKK